MQLFCKGTCNFGIFPNAIYTQLQSSTSCLNKNTDYLNIITIYDQVLLFCKSIFGMVLDAIYNFFNAVFWAIPIRTG